MPLVFTTQGGIEKHAEAALSQLAEAVAKAESKEAEAVKAEILEQILLTLARAVSRCIQRRCPVALGRSSAVASRIVREMAGLENWQ